MEGIEKRESSDDKIDYEKLYEQAINERDASLAYRVLSGSHTNDKQRACLIETIVGGDDPEAAAGTLRYDLMIGSQQREQLVRIVAGHGNPHTALDALRSNRTLTAQERILLANAINSSDDRWAKDVANQFLKGDF